MKPQNLNGCSIEVLHVTKLCFKSFDYRFKFWIPVQILITGSNFDYRFKFWLPVQILITGSNFDYRFKFWLPVQILITGSNFVRSAVELKKSNGISIHLKMSLRILFFISCRLMEVETLSKKYKRDLSQSLARNLSRPWISSQLEQNQNFLPRTFESILRYIAFMMNLKSGQKFVS